jgi:RNAse (barnase) inhibitor barstar
MTGDGSRGDDSRGDDSGEDGAERLCRGGAAARRRSGEDGAERPAAEELRQSIQRARRDGWAVLTLDTTGVLDKAALLERVQRDLHLPDWFGRNGDALADCLTDVAHPVGTLVVWTGWADLAAADPGTFATAREVFEEREGTDAGGRFAVLLLPPT